MDIIGKGRALEKSQSDEAKWLRDMEQQILKPGAKKQNELLEDLRQHL